MDTSSYFYDLCYPTSQTLLLATLGLLLWINRRHKTGLAFLATGLLWLVACATPAFTTWLGEGLERRYLPRDAAIYPDVDAIIVIGGDSPIDGQRDWGDEEGPMAATRVGFGYLLYKAGKAPIILLSAGAGGAQRMAAMLAQQGVPRSAMRIESRSSNTYENALYSSRILADENLRRVLLVTSPIHMLRAAASFRKQGLEVIPAPSRISPPVDKSPAATHAWWPQRSVLWISHHILHEYIGLAVYVLTGRA
jgi:uncharacterized SAM-binding protein YcdF (DUF218 family)